MANITNCQKHNNINYYLKCLKESGINNGEVYPNLGRWFNIGKTTFLQKKSKQRKIVKKSGPFSGKNAYKNLN